jgi:hypothetical protein
MSQTGRAQTFYKPLSKHIQKEMPQKAPMGVSGLHWSKSLTLS